MPKLRPRARIIRTIGDQLISGPEAALIELVKNAYDADSPFVLIKIEPPSATVPGGVIAVGDQGHGMSTSDVLQNWFEPATDEKVKRRVSPRGRLMLGAKGIGRFAASRLGRFTRLETVRETPKGQQFTAVDVDWNWFDSRRYLDEVEVPVHSEMLSTKATAETGLRLTIKELRDEWTKKHLETLIRELRRTASPVETQESGFKIRLDITAFSADTSGFEGQALLSELNFATDLPDGSEANDPLLIRPFGLRRFADYSLKGRFDADGAFQRRIQHLQRGQS